MKNLILASVLITGILAFGQQTDPLKLWYDEPSGDVWENALPLGNGNIGAMVYGNVSKEIFQLNESTVWSGSPNRNDNPAALEALPKIRQLIFDKQYKAAEDLANEKIITKKSHGQMFQPVGNLELTFEGHQNFHNYSRELNIGNAVSKTTYTVDGVTFTREAFTSLTDKVLVIKISADQPGKISFKADFTTPHKKQKIAIMDNNLSLWGVTSDHEGVLGKVEFQALLRIKTLNGDITQGRNTIEVTNTDSATLYISIASNFKNYDDLSADETLRAKNDLDKAFSENYENLKDAHIKAYQNYFNRVSLQLGTIEASNQPTDERLENFRKNQDPSFVSLYFQYGRYLLISSSKPGGQAANLQGIWNKSLTPPWDSKYTININAQMNYWPAEKTNLSELHEPFLNMVQELSQTGKKTANDMYGARGWMAHHNTDIWRVTGAIDGAFWGIWNGGGAWLSQHIWEHYLYTGDTEFLRENYDLLKGAALFYVDFLAQHPDHPYLVVAPGNSPENAAQGRQGTSITAGSTMDNQLVEDIFNAVISASEALNTDTAFTDSLKVIKKKLPPMQIGKHNQLQEWLEDLDSPTDRHRHISHLYGLYPSNLISPYRTPLLFAAARNTLIQRGDVSTGWSMGWKVNWWAKMQDGNHAFELIKNQLTPVADEQSQGGSYANLFDAHPPFQIDGNFGCTSGITEMLMQSSGGALHLLPAIADALKDGEVTGLKSRGGFEIINMKWKDKKLESVTIKSELGGNLRLRTPNQLTIQRAGNLRAAKGENTNPFFKVPQVASPIISKASDIEALDLPTTFLYDLKTEAGKTYTFKSKNSK